MNNFARPEIASSAVAILFVLFITLMTTSAVRSFTKELESKNSHYLGGATSLALLLCAFMVWFVFTVISMYAVNLQMAKNAQIYYISSSFFTLIAPAGFCVGYYFLSRVFRIGVFSDCAAIVAILFSSIVIPRDYCYLVGNELHISTGFYNSNILLNSASVDKIVLFKAIASRPKFDHVPIDDVVVYMKDGSRWTSAFYAANLTERRKFNAALLNTAIGVRIEKVERLYTKDLK